MPFSYDLQLITGRQKRSKLILEQDLEKTLGPADHTSTATDLCYVAHHNVHLLLYLVAGKFFFLVQNF